MSYKDKVIALLNSQELSEEQKEKLEGIFPELVESKDEQIRKALMQNLKERFGTKGNMGEGLDMPDVLAWLENIQYAIDHAKREGFQLGYKAGIEKQGEQKPNYCHHEVDLSECSEEYRKAYYDGWNNCNMQHSQCKSELDDVVKCLINGMKFYYEDNKEATWGTDKWSMPVKHIIEVLEKQCSQIPANSAKTCKDEQKSTDKIEPKFKVGDWVIDKQGIVHQIANVVKNVTNHTYGYDIVGGGYFNDNTEGVRLWTIQDAKDGDVLYEKRISYESKRTRRDV